jgi:hypothetical protein
MEAFTQRVAEERDQRVAAENKAFDQASAKKEAVAAEEKATREAVTEALVSGVLVSESAPALITTGQEATGTFSTTGGAAAGGDEENNIPDNKASPTNQRATSPMAKAGMAIMQS